MAKLTENTPKNTSNLKPKWQKGQSGNPAGRPKGSRNNATLMALVLLEADLQAITKVVIDQALNGDLTAAKFILDRLVPSMKDKPITLDEMPPIQNAHDLANAHETVFNAVMSGNITPSEGNIISGLLEVRRKSYETEELEKRIKQLEDIGHDATHKSYK